jgi:hypothetical protein
MNWPTFAEDFGKYLVTGIVTFGASLVYTEYRLLPGHNVNLVPLSISFEKANIACAVDRKKLTNSISHIRSSDSLSSPSQSVPYDSYIKALSKEVRASTTVLRELVPENLLKQLEDEQILTCNQPAPEGSTLALEAAALFEQPTTYLLKRSCFMVYRDVNIPIRVSIGVGSTNHQDTEPDTVSIRETGQLFFSYDQK